MHSWSSFVVPQKHKKKPPRVPTPVDDDDEETAQESEPSDEESEADELDEEPGTSLIHFSLFLLVPVRHRRNVFRRRIRSEGGRKRFRVECNWKLTFFPFAVVPVPSKKGRHPKNSKRLLSPTPLLDRSESPELEVFVPPKKKKTSAFFYSDVSDPNLSGVLMFYLRIEFQVEVPPSKKRKERDEPKPKRKPVVKDADKDEDVEMSPAPVGDVGPLKPLTVTLPVPRFPALPKDVYLDE